jgi:hypothetical protein
MKLKNNKVIIMPGLNPAPRKNYISIQTRLEEKCRYYNEEVTRYTHQIDVLHNRSLELTRARAELGEELTDKVETVLQKEDTLARILGMAGVAVLPIMASMFVPSVLCSYGLVTQENANQILKYTLMSEFVVISGSVGLSVYLSKRIDNRNMRKLINQYPEHVDKISNYANLLKECSNI